MHTRKNIEDIENQILAPYAMKSSQSQGRLFDEPQHAARTCYQRDRDRIVHSEAFRKLEYKTQVFVIFEGDYYRTRLTHTIEVAQIARTIGRNLRLNEDLIEAVALAHDLGHPPFGHAGEDQLNELMIEGDATSQGFNHNQRSFEVVAKYEKRYPEFEGLNLSFEVLVGIIKHETVFDKSGCVYILDDQVYAEKLRMAPCSLEAKLVDVADSLAYLNHDIDDGLTSGYICIDDLKENALFQRSMETVIAKGINVGERMFKYQVVKELIDVQVRDLMSTTYDRINTLGISSFDDVAQQRNNVIVGFSDEMKRERDELQSILLEKFYKHPRVELMTLKGKKVIEQLFHFYWQYPRQLPKHVYETLIQNDADQTKRYVICNHIASMTDRYALDEHRKLFEPYQKV